MRHFAITTVALTLLATAAQAQSREDVLERELQVQPGKAAVAFNRDYKNGGMARVRGQMNACWASLAKTPISRYGTKAIYCSAYALAAHSIDDSMAKQFRMPPTPGFDATTINSKVWDALIEANCPPTMVVQFADMIEARAVAALSNFAGR